MLHFGNQAHELVQGMFWIEKQSQQPEALVWNGQIFILPIYCSCLQLCQHK